MKDVLSNIRIDFSEDSLLFLNFALAFIMFGVALGIKTESFKELAKNPKSVIYRSDKPVRYSPCFNFSISHTFRSSYRTWAGYDFGSSMPRW